MKYGFIGVGNMAQAIIQGLLKAQTVSSTDINVHSFHQAHADQVAQKMHLTAQASNEAVILASDVVFLAVPANQILDLLTHERKPLTESMPIVVSMAAGVSLTEMSAILPGLAIVRIMPNVNVALNQGFTAVVGNDQAASHATQQMLAVFQQLGTALEMPEADFTTVSALAGSSPAFAYIFIDALARAGVEAGLSKPVADQIAAQAVQGSAAAVLAGQKSPWDLVDQVCSPGGTTVAGVLALQENGFATAAIKAVEATIQKDQSNQS
ncbi:proC protein [Lactobacillus selangorensis]|uniref:Pyrroline-5-carboxylate reductase n=1 Tax=Lactobacillus selangorensis TaxID=81857 RepID=A0A0R2FG85_9LACO|nr:pyrroline-5-carboxylate reductase [Lactobacillus selangorensis]KRN27230.1 proC protein [Lactobacillus selangorensis]KRN29848.1 proC protein [Lactobacillus selangorensis]